MFIGYCPGHTASGETSHCHLRNKAFCLFSFCNLSATRYFAQFVKKGEKFAIYVESLAPSIMFNYFVQKSAPVTLKSPN